MSGIHPEDPRLTAHVLGEASGKESIAIDEAAVVDPAVDAAIREARQIADLLESTLGAEQFTLGAERREAIRLAGRLPEPEKIVSLTRSRRWGRAAAVIAAAAAVVVGAVWVLLLIPAGEGRLPASAEAALRRDVQRQLLLSPPPVPEHSDSSGPGGAAGSRVTEKVPGVLPGTVDLGPIELEEVAAMRRLLQDDPEVFLRRVAETVRTAPLAELRSLPALVENSYVPSREEPRSLVPLVSGTASLALVERFVRGEGILPPENAVRIEELINGVRYEEAGDAMVEGVHLGAELVRCPWDENTLLLGVLLQNNAETEAPEEARLYLETIPEWISSYRLIGHARVSDPSSCSGRLPQTLRAGTTNYVIYELLPAREELFAEHWVAVHLRLALQGNENPVLHVPVVSPPGDWSTASGNFQTASALAACGLLLRDSSYRGALDPAALEAMVEQAMESARSEDLARREALDLVRATVPLLEESR